MQERFNADMGQRPAGKPLGQPQGADCAGFHQMPCLYRRRCRSHPQWAAVLFAEVHRNLPRVVAGRKTRLVRAVVFLVNDDKPKTADGSEYGAAHADDNPCFAPRNPPPFRQPLAAG